MTEKESESLQARIEQLERGGIAAAGSGLKQLPSWARWLIYAVVGVLLLIGLLYAWDLVFGDGVEAAKENEKLHAAIMRLSVALVISWVATALSLIILSLALDWLTARREFLEKVTNNEASDLSMAVFSIGTALYAGLIFHAVLDALSLN